LSARSVSVIAVGESGRLAWARAARPGRRRGGCGRTALLPRAGTSSCRRAAGRRSCPSPASPVGDERVPVRDGAPAALPGVRFCPSLPKALGIRVAAGLPSRRNALPSRSSSASNLRAPRQRGRGRVRCGGAVERRAGSSPAPGSSHRAGRFDAVSFLIVEEGFVVIRREATGQPGVVLRYAGPDALPAGARAGRDARRPRRGHA